MDQAMCRLGFTAAPIRRLVTGHNVAEGRLNGHPATFIVDTGANLSMVHAAHAQRFGLQPQRGFAVAAGLGGPLSAARADVGRWELGDVRVAQTHVVVADLAQVEALLQPLAGTPIHGIIGQDVLRRQGAIIDVARPMLYVRAMDDTRSGGACAGAAVSTPPSSP